MERNERRIGPVAPVDTGGGGPEEGEGEEAGCSRGPAQGAGSRGRQEHHVLGGRGIPHQQRHRRRNGARTATCHCICAHWSQAAGMSGASRQCLTSACCACANRYLLACCRCYFRLHSSKAAGSSSCSVYWPS